MMILYNKPNYLSNQTLC